MPTDHRNEFMLHSALRKVRRITGDPPRPTTAISAKSRTVLGFHGCDSTLGASSARKKILATFGEMAGAMCEIALPKSNGGGG
jgi:hypothetical protein